MSIMELDRPIKKVVSVRFVGTTAAARVLGCSQSHLTYVLIGKRKPGAALAAKLMQMGYTFNGDGYVEQ